MMAPVIEADRLFRFFHVGDEETLALRGVTLAVQPGELLAVTGPSGSGKSTLLACLAGLDEPDGGTVKVAGQVMSRRPEPERAALRARAIGMVFQSANLFEHLTLDRNLALSQSLAGRPDRDRRAALLAELGLDRRARAFPSELSGGEAARAGLAVALVNDPAVVLADEPTGEVDASAEARVLTVLRERAAAGGAVIVVTHSRTVSAEADRVVGLLDGEVVD